MGQLKDLIGEKFGRLTVIKRTGSNKYKKALWLCKCDCDGNEKEYISSQLLSGKTKSCGCLQKENVSKTRKKYNTYDLTGEYGIGYTSNTNEPFYFDLEDYDKIKDYCWSKNEDEYIVTKINNTTLFQHRIIMNARKDEEVDHIFHKNYDNRKSQLRICTISQNGFNMLKAKDNTSGVKGVRWHKRDNKWEAFIVVNKKQIYLGYFTDFEDAVKERKEAEIKYHGDFRLKDK